MKKIIFVLILLAGFSPVFAQNSGDRPDIFYVNVPVERVYTTEFGYLVQYRRSGLQMGMIGIPMEWFAGPVSKAELINLGTGSSLPNMSIFYKDGEFSHVKLYVRRARGHETWANVPQYADVSRFFSDSETLDIQF